MKPAHSLNLQYILIPKISTFTDTRRIVCIQLVVKQKMQFKLFIMKGSNFEGSVHLLIALAQVLNKNYINKLSTTTFYITFLISQLIMLLEVTRKFFLSLQLTIQLSVFIDKISNYLTLSSQNNNLSGIQTTIVRFFISILHLTTVISLLALFIDKKNRLSMALFLQNYLNYSFHVLIAFSVPFLLFSISQLFNRSILSELEKPLDIFNIICLFIIIYAVQWSSIDVGAQQNSQSIKRIYKSNIGFSKIGKILVIGSFYMSNKSQIEYFFIYLILIVVHVSELSNLCRCRKYMNQNLQKMKEVICSIWIACLLVITIVHMFPLQIVLNNIISLFLTVNFLFYFSFTAYRDYKRSKELIQGYEIIKSQEKAISFALELISQMKQSNQNQTTVQKLFKSLFIQKHKKYCEKAMCVCQNKRSFQTDSILIKIVAENILQEISQKFPYSFCLKFLLVGFKIKNGPKIININHRMNQFLQRKSLDNLSFQQKFIVLELKKYIINHFSQHSHIESHIKCENIFLEQSIKDKFHLILNMIIVEMADKHKLLMQDYYTLNSVQQFSLKINKLICEMQDVWVRVCQINSFNHQLFRLFIFYYQNVVPSHIQGTKIARQIMQNLDKLKHLKGFSKEIMNKYVYSRKSCVIQSNLQQSFGKVTNVSKYCFDVLGYRRQQIMNKDINQIMPQYFAKSHKQSMDLWLQKCTDSQYRTEMGEFGYVDTLQICFQGFFLMKILAGQNKLLFYSVLIRQNDNDYILINSQKEIEGIGKRLIKEDVFTQQNIKHSFNQYCDFNFDKKTIFDQKFRGKILLQDTHKQTILNSIEGINSLQKLNKSKCKYQCIVNISKHFICKQFYYMIKFQNITKRISSQDQFQYIRIDPKRQQNSKLPFSLKMIDGEIMEIQQNESVQPVTNNIHFTQMLNLSIKNSSLASNGFSEVAYYNRFIKDIKRVLIDPTLVPLNYFKRLTILFLILSVCMMAQFFSLRKLFVVGFNSFNDVMFGDGAVSDNNQLLQIMYNHVLMSRAYCQEQRQSARCNYLLNNTATISHILYNMYLDNVKVYLQNRTALSGLKFYASYEIQVPYYFGKDNKTEQITTMQFMQFYYGAVRKVCDEISAGRVNSIEADAAMNVLFKNWETMKFINHNAIYFYLSAGQSELNLLRNYLLFLGAGLVICIFTFGICLKRYDNAVVRKKINIISIHTCMGKQLLRELTNYYTYLKEVASDLKFIPDKFESYQCNHNCQNRKQSKYKHSSKLCLAQIIAIILAITILGSIEILRISLVLPACMNMAQNINNLMDSQNYLLENYFEMKTFYLAYNFSKSVDQISHQIAVHLNQTEPLFTKVATDSVDLFSADPTFTKDFNDLLVVDSCKLTAFLFEPWQVHYCINNFTTPILSLGLVSGMTFFQRNAYGALSELLVKQHQNINKTAYFMQDVFTDIDDSIFYMFRLYQATQDRMYKGLRYIVNSSLFLLDTINAFSTLILVFVMFWWLKSYRTQQRQVSQLYGIVLQFPLSIMKTQIITRIKRQLEINH